MDSVIVTPRLRLTILTSAEKGSPQFDWLHEIHSDVQCTLWALSGRSKDHDGTVTRVNAYLPCGTSNPRSYRIAYAVHETLDQSNVSVNGSSGASGDHSQADAETKFVGLIYFKPYVEDEALKLPENLTLPAAELDATLMVELAYTFLPAAWGRGYATECVNALLAACRRAPATTWAPYQKLYVMAIVNGRNAASQRVLAKTEMLKKGPFSWKGGPIYIGGKWVEEEELIIYGAHVVGD